MRRALQPIIKQKQFNVLLTTYDFVIRDKGPLSKIEWRYLIIDEGTMMISSSVFIGVGDILMAYK